MNRNSVLLRSLLLTGAAALSACVTSPYYTPASGSVYYVQDPWFYRNSYRDCYDVWYGCSRPYYGHSHYGGHYYPPPVYHHPPPARPPSKPAPPPDDKPVYAPKPPRLIRLSDSAPPPGRVIAPAPAARPPAAVRVEPKPLLKPAPAPRQIRVEQSTAKPDPAGHARILRKRPER